MQSILFYIVRFSHQYLQKLIVSNQDNAVTQSVSGLAALSQLERPRNLHDLVPSAHVL